MNGSKLAFGLVFILIAFIVIGCKTTKAKVRVTDRPLNEILEGVKNSQISYERFYGKTRIKFNGTDTKFGGRSNIIMVKDSAIWLNIKKLSIEGARALIRPDSCWILYRFDDLYESGQTKEFLDYYKLYVSFSEFQDLIIGNLPYPSEPEVIRFASDYAHEISFYRSENLYEYSLDEDLSIFRVKISDPLGRSLTTYLKDYDENGFAKRKDFEISLPDEGTSKFSIKFSTVAFDVHKEIKFEIPADYRRLP